MKTLREFYPAARGEDWRLIDAGIRVQAIKSSEGKTGIVHYGTEIITNADRSIAALLGASPGASVSASIAIEVVERCLPELLQGPVSRKRMQAIVPSYGVDLKAPQNAAYFTEISQQASHILQLTERSA